MAVDCDDSAVGDHLLNGHVTIVYGRGMGAARHVDTLNINGQHIRLESGQLGLLTKVNNGS